MPVEHKPYYKPLLFTTTMRNPERIAEFLEILLPFENSILTDSLILKIEKQIISKKLYVPLYISRNADLKEKLKDDSYFYTDKEADEIINNSPQNHKEAGFSYGWSSRFDTQFKFPMELGFVFYEMDCPLIISNTGHMLIDAYKEETPNGGKIQNVFLNAMMKYQTNNPFRKIKNENAPLILLLQVINLLNSEKGSKKTGISRSEIPLIICWTNKDARELYLEIKKLRNKFGFQYSDETIYEICLKKLEAEEKTKRFKLKSIIYEYVDEFIRKMRITGMISLRGNGRFIDINTFETKKINYILENYSNYCKYLTRKEYFNYLAEIDQNILSESVATKIDNLETIKEKSLETWATYYKHDQIIIELKKLSEKKASTDLILKEISGPTRLEFLAAIALKQKFSTLKVIPNYKIDDEGLPVFTAPGGIADIECISNNYNSMIEVTLMRNRSQSTNEIPAITRHLQEAKEKYYPKYVFSIFIAPNIHADTIFLTDYSRDNRKVNIFPFSIIEFISKINTIKTLDEIGN